MAYTRTVFLFAPIVYLIIKYFIVGVKKNVLFWRIYCCMNASKYVLRKY